MIASTVKKDLLVQSWRNGARGVLKSDCEDKYTVQNVDKTTLIKSSWHYKTDHSKWGITIDSYQTSFNCISDTNRMKSQFKRGGGSVCSNSVKV